jgi:tRNA-specific adenosine deaminase 1
MAALKDSFAWPSLPPGVPARGRNNYSLRGVLRTKPGRSDAPPTACMTCSDKIAVWNVAGLQGALLATFLAEPVYVSDIVIGDVPEAMRELVREDCERAFWKRVGDLKCEWTALLAILSILTKKLLDLPYPYVVNHPHMHFTSLSFVHAQSATKTGGSCNECKSQAQTRPNRIDQFYAQLCVGLMASVNPKSSLMA